MMSDMSLQEKWFLIDAEGQTLGKVAEKAARLVRGKHKVDFDPSRDGGDNVVIINAEKIRVSRARKEESKKYYTHSRYPGGLKEKSFGKARRENPVKVMRMAVSGMLPKNKLRALMLRRRLKIYAGGEHPHEAQKPEEIKI